MYEEKQTFDVLKRTVPDFANNGDIILAYTIDGKPGSGNFPKKDSRLYVKSTECQNGATADWSSQYWGLINVEPGENKKVVCTVHFTEEYREDILNGADPVLNEELVPVTIEDKGVVKKADLKEDWYSYKDKRWANAVILNETGKSQNIEAGTQIQEDWIESYFVWIPKYSYKLFDDKLGLYESQTGKGNKTNMVIDIKFGLVNTKDGIAGECATPMLNEYQGESGGSGECKQGDYITHPAFLAFDTNGIWVGKFEPNKNSANQIQIKPNVSAWIVDTIGEGFQIAKSYKETTNLQSHMMKNTEWGAIANLTQSIYGRCTQNSCTRVAGNFSTVTGAENKTSYVNNSVGASTTNNYSGIYDLHGGEWEVLASVMLNQENTEPMYGNSGLDSSSLSDERYYDIYKYSSATNYSKRILGDATGEFGPFSMSEKDKYSNQHYIGSMYMEMAQFLDSTHPWFYRGGYYWDYEIQTGGVFSFHHMDGGRAGTFRVVLAPES